MTNFVASADKFNYVCPEGGVKSGAVVIAGKLIGIAMTDGAAGDVVACVRSGVFRLPKAGGVIAQGAVVNINDGAVTTSGGEPIGSAAAAAGADDAEVDVMLGVGA